jgi:hypothetical protein
MRQCVDVVPMEPTQLSATLKPHRRPDPETLDRFSSVLKWEPSRLRRWYGYEVNAEPPPPLLPLQSIDRVFDPARIVAFVESKPDEAFQAQLAQEKERRKDKPGSYERLCLRINRAWTSNGDLIMEELAALGTE